MSLRAALWLESAIRTANGCLEWRGSRDKDGYGRVRINGRKIPAHRAIYMEVHGVTLLPDEFVCHSCDNPPCINPDHLWVGSSADNVRDCLAKGRPFGMRPRK